MDYRWAVAAIPLVTIIPLILGFFVVPHGHEGVEGGPVDHNWGGHAWAHATTSLGILFCLYHIHINRRTSSLAEAWAANPFAVLAFCAVLWGGIGLFLDGVLTAFVGDDTTWTHHPALQAALQSPYMLGGLILGPLALVRRRRRRRAGPEAWARAPDAAV